MTNPFPDRLDASSVSCAPQLSSRLSRSHLAHEGCRAQDRIDRWSHLEDNPVFFQECSEIETPCVVADRSLTVPPPFFLRHVSRRHGAREEFGEGAKRSFDDYRSSQTLGSKRGAPPNACPMPHACHIPAVLGHQSFPLHTPCLGGANLYDVEESVSRKSTTGWTVAQILANTFLGSSSHS